MKPLAHPRRWCAPAWNGLARLRPLWRWPVKMAVFGLVVLGTLFPRPDLLVQHVRHLLDLESLIQPDLPELAEINRRITATLKPDATPREEFRAVERYVHERIRYEYDWFNWGNLDYWPTARQTLERGREDCDGRAVLAASILRARGFTSATVVGNLQHVWVQVDKAELMGPRPDKNFRRVGDKLVFTPPQWRTVLESSAMIRKFPAPRSLLILLVALVLAYHPCRHPAGFFALTSLALAGFVVFLGWADRFDDNRDALLLGPLLGALALLGGALLGALLAARVLHPQAGTSPAPAGAAGSSANRIISLASARTAPATTNNSLVETPPAA